VLLDTGVVLGSTRAGVGPELLCVQYLSALKRGCLTRAMSNYRHLGMAMAALLLPSLVSGCASNWKIHGGPAECVSMCRNWNLEFAGMVGVGNQDRTGSGATACVCQVPRSTASLNRGEASTTASLAGPITAAQAAAAAHAAQQQQRQAQAR